MKNSFIAFALCMVGGQVHGVSSNNDSAQILCTMLDKNVLVEGMMPLKDMTDLSWEPTTHPVQTTMGNDNWPVVCIKKNKTVVAARIDDNRNGNEFETCLYGGQLEKLISDLQNQHGLQVPIQVRTPHRKPVFYKATGKLYSDAEEVEVYDSHDMAVYIKPGGELITVGHSGHLRTNAGDISLWSPCHDMTMICDNGNKEVVIFTGPDAKPVTVKLDNFQGELVATGPQTTVRVEKSRFERAAISRQAKALFDHTTITGDVSLADHASLVLFGSNVEGSIEGPRDSGVFKVDSTGTVRELKLKDGAHQCGEYTVSSEGDVDRVPELMAQQIDEQNPDDAQKAADTLQKFNALWEKCDMPNHNAPEESKE